MEFPGPNLLVVDERRQRARKAAWASRRYGSDRDPPTRGMDAVVFGYATSCWAFRARDLSEATVHIV